MTHGTTFRDIFVLLLQEIAKDCKRLQEKDQFFYLYLYIVFLHILAVDSLLKLTDLDDIVKWHARSSDKWEAKRLGHLHST